MLQKKKDTSELDRVKEVAMRDLGVDESELEEYDKVFRLLSNAYTQQELDDDDGAPPPDYDFITVEKLKRACRAIGVQSEDVSIMRLIAVADRNDDGMISHAEFVRMMTARAAVEDDEHDLEDAFKHMGGWLSFKSKSEANGKGSIAKANFVKWMETLLSNDDASTEAGQVFDHHDTNGDGVLSLEEFKDSVRRG